jgi:hypothetical protein
VWGREGVIICRWAYGEGRGMGCVDGCVGCGGGESVWMCVLGGGGGRLEYVDRFVRGGGLECVGVYGGRGREVGL